MSPLFRREVADARRDAWLGRVQLAQPLPVRLTSAASVALVAALIAYLALGAYTRRVRAEGVLTPHAGLITVASPAPGLIRTDAASEGAKVAAGQLLYEIDLDAASADGPTQERILADIRERRASLQRAPAARRAAAAIERQALANQLQNLVAQHNELGREIEITEQLIPAQTSRLDQLREATRKGLALAQEFQNQQFVYLQTASQLAQFRQARIQTEGRVAETQAGLDGFDGKLSQQLDEIEREILRLDQQIAEAEAKRAVRISAPADGVLTAIAAHAGQTVAAGAPLLTLLKDGGGLEAHLYVDSSAIGFVRPGAPVLLRYAAFPFQRFGLYRGAVTEVTRAPVDHAPEVAAGSGGRLLYRVTAAPSLPYVLADGRRRRLEAGMRVEADIALDTRPLYRWLLDPFYRWRRSLAAVSGGGA